MLELGLPRSSLRYQVQPSNDDALRLAMIRLAERYGWYGYRTITALLRLESWRVEAASVKPGSWDFHWV